MNTRMTLFGNGISHPGLVAAAGVIAIVAATSAASASTCVEQVEKLAVEHDLTIGLPDAGSPVKPDDLARSDGVIAPPSTGDPVVIEPPETPGSAMPTAPDLSRDDETAPLAPALSSADLLMLEGILISARAEAENGDIERCFERLRKAQSLIAERTG